jgi:hypothetical protein
MSGGVVNGDYVPDEFMPGIRSAGNLAPGTDPPGSRAVDSVETTITGPSGETWNRYGTQTHGSIEPGQTSDGLTGVTEDQITQTGAGRGHVISAPRRTWQAKDGAS